MIRNFIITVILTFATFLTSFGKADNSRPEVEILTSIQKSGVVGEVFEYVVTLKSNSRDISNVQAIKYPKFDNNLKVLRGAVSGNATTEKKEKGKTFYYTTIQKNYIIPEKSGKYDISDSEYVVFIPHVEIVQDYFWGAQRVMRYEEIKVKAKGISFKVSDLPRSNGKREECSGVGEFTIEGWFPPGEIHSGRDAYVVFTISGFGDLSNVKISDISHIFHPNQLKEIERDEHQTQRQGRMYSEITLTCKFVPDSQDFQINPLSLTFYNPSTNKYYEASSLPLHWSGVKENGRRATDTEGAIEI